MGSTGPDYQCPLCGASRGGGYALDAVGYPLGPCCLDRVMEGESPCRIKSKQVEGIAGLRSGAASEYGVAPATERNSPNLASVLEVEGIRMKVAALLLPAADNTSDFWRYGLDERGEAPLNSLDLRGRACIVLGAEGEGLRRLTAEKCDRLITIPTSAALAALNVSNAAAVAAYEWARQRQSA